METPPRPSVLLRHEYPGAPEKNHFDWLFERTEGDDPDERSLLAFRVVSRPDESTDFDATRLPDHRRRYLTYEGPVAGDRGEVRRVWQGDASVREMGDSIEIEIREIDGVTRWTGTPIEGDRWRFVRETDPH